MGNQGRRRQKVEVEGILYGTPKKGGKRERLEEHLIGICINEV